MTLFVNLNGITVRELKAYVKNLPEKNDAGRDFEVWLDSGNQNSNPCQSIWPLNRQESGSDILFKLSP